MRLCSCNILIGRMIPKMEQTKFYETPDVEFISTRLDTALVNSPLENPEDGGEWTWD